MTIVACNSVEVEKEKCQQDPQKWEKYVEYTSINFFWKNKYFDFNDFSGQPIKEFLNNQFHGLQAKTGATVQMKLK